MSNYCLLSLQLDLPVQWLLVKLAAEAASCQLSQQPFVGGGLDVMLWYSSVYIRQVIINCSQITFVVPAYSAYFYYPMSALNFHARATTELLYQSSRYLNITFMTFLHLLCPAAH
jgi:hypothetical protein